MPNQTKLFLALLTIIPILVLSGCGGSPRADDAVPVQAEAPPPTATVAPSDQSPAVVEAATAAPAQADSTAETQPEQAGAENALTFNLSGGVIGFCDTLTVKQSGEYVWQSCEDDQSTGQLVADDLESLQSWLDNLAAFTISTEDNPSGPDNLVSELVFAGNGSQAADELQRQLIFDWVNGLLVRVRPQPVAPPPSPTPTQAEPSGLCPEVDHPAVLVANYDDPSRLGLVDLAGQTCDIVLSNLPFGRIVTAAGHLYYPAFDPDTETVTVWQISPDGSQSPLDFTQVAIEQFGPFNITVSPDGTMIAWAQTTVDAQVDPPIYRNSLWVARTDGSELVSLFDQVENGERRYLEPVRFGADNATLFYALQPDGLAGNIFDFSGRYENLYTAPVRGGEPTLVLACPPGPTQATPCIGDISADGSLLAYSDPANGLVQVVGLDGSTVSTLTPPATDFVGPAVFGPTGQLAFVSATLTATTGEEDEVLTPEPGYISLVEPPYAGQPATLLADNSVVTLWEWLDENHLAYGALDEAGNLGTAVITLDGQVTQLSPNFALGVLR